MGKAVGKPEARKAEFPGLSNVIPEAATLGLRGEWGRGQATSPHLDP